MRIYVSASDPKRAREAALLVGTVLGHEVVSRWHESERPAFKDAAGWTERVASNLADLDGAEVVVALPAGGGGSFGTQLEIGYAVGKGKRVIVLAGKLPSALLRHAIITHVTTADELEAALKELAEVVTVKVMKVDDPKPARKGKPKQKVTQ